jgi:hypothetical protein
MLVSNDLTQAVRDLAKQLANSGEMLSAFDAPAKFQSFEVLEIYVNLSKAISTLEEVKSRIEGIEDVDFEEATECNWTIEQWNHFLNH